MVGVRGVTANGREFGQGGESGNLEGGRGTPVSPDKTGKITGGTLPESPEVGREKFVGDLSEGGICGGINRYVWGMFR